MTCPNCGSSNVYVKETTPDPNGKVYRRRHCADCDARFRTVETTMDDTDEARKEYLDAVKNKSSVIRAYYENK